MNKTQIYMNLAIVIVTAVVFIIATTKTKLQEDENFRKKHELKIRNRFSIYYENIFTRSPFRRIVQMYSSLSCYNENELKVNATQLFERNLAIMFAMPLAGLIIFREFVMGLFFLFLGYIYYQTTVESALDKIYVTIMEECSLTISSIRERFLETDSIPTAVLTCEKSKYLEVPINNIYRILTAVDGPERLQAFQHQYPVMTLRTLANVCYIVSENGSVSRKDGSKSFADDLTILRQEADAEIRRLTKIRIAYNRLRQLSLLGLIVLPASEFYLLHFIPGTAVLLKGFYGEMLNAGTLIATCISYWYICTSARPSIVSTFDRNFLIDFISKNRKFSKIIDNVMPKNKRTIMKVTDQINNALSAKDIRYIYSTKVILSIAVFFFSLLFLAISMVAVKTNFKNNYNSLSFVPMTITDNQHNQIVTMDDKFIRKTWGEYQEMDDEKILTLVKGSITGLSDSDAQNQVTRLRTKYETIHNAHFYWWFVWVAFALAIIAWHEPEIALGFRHRLVQYEAGEDVSQLQTIMIVLSDTSMDVYNAIIWLEKQATIHKTSLRYCHYTFISNPMRALDKLELSSPINDFKRLVRKLKSAVYVLSLQDAFSDMAIDKAQSLTLREMLRNEELELRKNNAKLFAILPAGVALIFGFIGPVIILGVKEMMGTFNELNTTEIVNQ